MQGVNAAGTVEAEEYSVIHRDVFWVREAYTSVLGERLTTIEAQ